MIRSIRFPVLTFCILMMFLLSEKAEAGGNRDSTIRINSTLLRIQWPEGKVRGAILMLPGWNFSRAKTCENSSFCSKALQKGFVLISPEMGKSLYASRIYPNSRKEWAACPQLRFITDTLQPRLQQQFGLLKQGQRNFIYGISTGARGGALILEHTDSLYAGAALLSGDYDQCADPSDNLMNGFYGSYKQYPERWEGDDNPSRNAGKIRSVLYIGHGKADQVVPFAQSNDFYNRLKQQGAHVTFSAKDKQGHNFEFWDSETEAVLNLFCSLLEK
jgi:S-formylglutathione hydrolase FrmB